jgi:hypothetical protein
MFEPDVMSASVEGRAASDATVHVRLRSEDVSVIKRQEIYFSLVIVNCGDEDLESSRRGGYPMEPYIAGQRAAEFKFPLPDGQVDVTGQVPVWLLKQYRQPCVFLEGGNYLGGRMRSKVAPLASRR